MVLKRLQFPINSYLNLNSVEYFILFIKKLKLTSSVHTTKQVMLDSEAFEQTFCGIIRQFVDVIFVKMRVLFHRFYFLRVASKGNSGEINLVT